MGLAYLQANGFPSFVMLGNLGGRCCLYLRDWAPGTYCGVHHTSGCRSPTTSECSKTYWSVLEQCWTRFIRNNVGFKTVCTQSETVPAWRGRQAGVWLLFTLGVPPVPLMGGCFSLGNLAQLPQQGFLTEQCSELLALFSSATLVITTARLIFNF